MDVTVDSVYDIQYADDADKDNQYLAQHFDLFKTLLHLIAALKVGKPMRSRIFAAPVVKPAFKSIRISIIQ